MLSRKHAALIRGLYTRHGRRKLNMCVAEGVRCCSELFAARPDLVEFVFCAPSHDGELFPGEVIHVTDSDLASVSATISSQGILAVARIPESASHDLPIQDDVVFALDRVGDPGNFGTVARTLRAAGLNELWYTSGSCDPYGEKTIRAALGAHFAMNLRVFDDLESLRTCAAGHGFDKVFLTDPHQGENCFATQDLFSRSVVVIGSEGDGVGVLDGARRVTIPMPGGFESLNAAQAATIFIFEHVRRLTAEPTRKG